METKSGQKDSGNDPASSRGTSQIFLCDASAEGGRLLTALQAKGYIVVDVPLGLLPSRIHYDVPTLIVCDADALEAKRRLQETFEAIGKSLPVALIGHTDGAMLNDEALRALAHVSIARPVDLDTALEKVSDIAGPPSRGSHRPRIKLSSRAPLLVAAARKPYRSDGYPAEPPSSGSSHPPAADDSLWPVDSPPGRGPSPVDSHRLAYEGPGRSQVPSSHPPSSDKLSLSPETQAVLEEGKKRVKAYSAQSPRPIRLPADAHAGGEVVREEFLIALTEPLDEHLAALDRTDRGRVEPATAGGDEAKTNPGGQIGSAPPQSGKTEGAAPGSAPPSMGGGIVSHQLDGQAEEEEDEPTNPGGKPPTQPPPESRDRDSYPLSMKRPEDPPPLDDLSDLLNTKSSRPPTSLPAVSIDTERPGSFSHMDSTTPAQLLATVPPPTRRPHPPATPFDESGSHLPLSQPAPAIPPSFAPPKLTFQDRGVHGTRRTDRTFDTPSKEDSEHAMIQLAAAISSRRSGAVAQQEGVGLRRIVLTDGDISTVASTLQDESLAHFLRVRGDISADILATLGSIPRFGRHGGAALIARGLLQQEDLWPVLRAHAEWIMERALSSEAATVFETSVPDRILEEPAVFGGAAGTEIYLETMRRILSPPEALSFFGSEDQVLSLGQNESLLGESALAQVEQSQVLEAVGKPVGQLMKNHPELLPILLGLTYLDVLSTGGRSPRPAPRPTDQQPVFHKSSDEIDDEAFAARVQNRRALVEEGDYFSILGISRGATRYEVDRARDALLAEYDDSRVTARNAHLLEALELVRATVEEAHLVLRDDVRRQRYRAALEAVPRAH